MQRRRDTFHDGVCSSCGKPVSSPHYKTCEQCLEAKREWCVNNHDKKHDYDITWREEHPEYEREYRKTRREYNREKSRRWRRDNPEKRRINNNNHRARKKNNGGTFTFKELNELFEQQEGFCFYCGELLYASFDKEVHIEHKTPISRGGKNDISNIAISCARCNLQKGTKTHEEYLQLRNS
jgi:CRISPR/Cas system Type II protein with McrA/HNH and RuvC-like nuclease domain